MPARQVDEVRLADRLEGRGVVALGGVAHEHRLHLGAQRPEVLDAHLGPRAERRLAVGRGRRRQDRDARPRTARGREQASVELGHGCEELTGADERHGTGHRRAV